MSTRRERYENHMKDVDSYITNQMAHRTDTDKATFRQWQIDHYDDMLERHAEKIKQMIIASLRRAPMSQNRIRIEMEG